MQQIRRENALLDSQFHESDKSINQLKASVVVLEQDIKDKEQVISIEYEVNQTAYLHNINLFR